MHTKLRWTALPGVIAMAALVVGCASGAPGARNQAIGTYLECASVITLPPQDTTMTIGPGGGSVVLGRGDGVRFSNGAVTPPPRNVRVRQLNGPRRGIQVVITPAAPTFAAHVVVFVSTAGCTAQELGSADWAIYRMDQQDQSRADRLVTRREGDRLWAITDRNSFFIVAD
jgi:hypothetical protein